MSRSRVDRQRGQALLERRDGGGEVVSTDVERPRHSARSAANAAGSDGWARASTWATVSVAPSRSPSAMRDSTSTSIRGSRRVASPTISLIPAPRHRSGQRGLAPAQVDLGQRETGGEPVLLRREKVRRLVESTLDDAEPGQRGGRIDAMTDARRSVGPERAVERLFRLVPSPGFDEHGAVRADAMGAEHLRPTVHPVEDHGVDQADPLLGPRHVPRTIAGAQHRAEGLSGGSELGDLAGADRGECFVDAGEPVVGPTLRHQRQAAVGERSHLEVGVAVLVGDRQGSIGRCQQVVHVRTVARHVGQLVVAPVPDRARCRREPDWLGRATPETPTDSRGRRRGARPG